VPKGKRESDSSGTGGGVEIAVPRARLTTPEGKTAEWKSQALRVYQRRTLAADALIASSYLAGANTRRVGRALAALFAGTVGKDTVSRVWRKVKSDWDVARCHHGFAGCPFAESGKAAGAGPVRGLFMCRSSRAIVPGASAASPDSAGCARFRRNRFLKAAKPARNGSRLINGAWSIAAGSEFLRHDGSISISLRRHRRAGSCVPEGPFCCGASLGPHPGRWLDAAVDN
jgi:hypothetical protein